MDGSVARHGPFAVKTKKQNLLVEDLKAGSFAKKPTLVTRSDHGRSHYPKQDSYVLRVDKVGWVAIDAQSLLGASSLDFTVLENAINERQYELTNNGVSIPVWFADGTMHFYAHDNGNHNNPSNYYMLKRGTPRHLKAKDAPSKSGNIFSVELRSSDSDDLFPVLAYPDVDQDDFGYRARLFSGDPESQDSLLTLEAKGPEGQGELIISGLSVGMAEGQRLDVMMNGQKIEELSLPLNRRFERSFAVPDGAIKSLNDVSLELNQGGVFVDEVTLFYNGFLPENYSGAFVSKNTATMELKVTDDVLPPTVLDVTDSLNPVYVLLGIGKGHVSFDVTEDHEYHVIYSDLTPDTIRPLMSFEPDAAQHVVLGPQHLSVPANDLVELRNSQDLESVFVSYESLVDRFSFGNPSGDPVARYLRWRLSETQSLPDYVVLLGDQHFDAAGLYSPERPDLPHRLMGSPYGLISSDMALSDVDGDGVPDIALGHIPANSVDEMQRFVKKIEDYESQQKTYPSTAVAHISGRRATAGHFHGMLQTIEDSLPKELDANVYSADHDDSSDKLSEVLSQNNLWTFLAGHGSMDRLTDVVQKDEVLGLPNTNPTFMSWFSCLSHRGELPGFRTLAESLLLETKGGAIASFGPTSLTSNGESRILSKLLSDTMLYSDLTRIGDITLNSLKGYADKNPQNLTLETYTLLGDPATQIQLPNIETPQSPNHEEPSLQGGCNTTRSKSGWVFLLLLGVSLMSRRRLQ